ncbi:hypothetical protein HS088_TW18G00271 [Tripterygium wilfordii]|uniref:Uncharacterized protein n=1 Tax=Tripterygium wilfordii TaxID=458696 RepID=A0A7J7CBX7_TRIWF|nr:hypothetical protein HS088_TW18G00271 [Tripterygium wilfordii]
MKRKELELELEMAQLEVKRKQLELALEMAQPEVKISEAQSPSETTDSLDKIRAQQASKMMSKAAPFQKGETQLSKTTRLPIGTRIQRAQHTAVSSKGVVESSTHTEAPGKSLEPTEKLKPNTVLPAKADDPFRMIDHLARQSIQVDEETNPDLRPESTKPNKVKQNILKTSINQTQGNQTHVEQTSSFRPQDSSARFNF